MPLTQVPSGMLQTTAQYYGFKNRIINGAMNVNQYALASATTNILGSTYFIDRFQGYGNVASKFTMLPNLNSVTPPTGFTNYAGMQSSSAYTLASGDLFLFRQIIEGNNVTDFAWGSSSAKSIAVSFWVYSSLTGTFGGCIYSAGNSSPSSYTFSYSIPVANTWTYISFTLNGPTSGGQTVNNLASIQFCLGLGVGSASTTAAGTWTSGALFSPPGCVNVVSTNNATFYVTGVQFEVGTQATSFDYRPYTTELQLCQRYYAKFGANNNWFLANNGVTSAEAIIKYPTTMRASPTTTNSGLGIYLYTGGTVPNYSSYYRTTLTQDQALLGWNMSGGGTNGTFIGVINTGSTTGYLDFSAEL